MALEDPAGWSRRSIDIAGTAVTVDGLRVLLSEVLGRPVELDRVPWSDYEARAGVEMTVMMRWFDDVGYDVDVPALRAEFPWLKRLDDYRRRLAYGTP